MHAFEDCYNLVDVCDRSSLKITAGGEDNGFVGRYACNVYKDDEGKSDLFITENGYEIYEDDEDCVIMGYHGEETDLVLPEFSGGKKYGIAMYAFYESNTLKSVVIPDYVTWIGSLAFGDCDKLIKLTVGSGVTKIGKNAFFRCRKLKDITNRSSVKIVLGK